MAARKKARTTRRKATRARRPARSKATRRKKATRKKSTRKKATRKKAARKKAPRKKAGRKKAAKKKVAKRKAPKRKPARKPARKTAVASASAAELLARKIVHATLDPSQLQLEDLYAENCTSLESGGGPPAEGHEGLRQKMATWGQMQDGTTWRARNIFVKGNTISIEWDCVVKLKDGRSVSFKEVAIHEVKGGKIVAERYYYDPGQLAPPAAEPAPPPPPPPPVRSDPGVPPVNPLDL